MTKIIWKCALLLVLILMVTVLVPSATMVAGAETKEDTPCPTYEPVELAQVTPLKFTKGTPYRPNPEKYLENNWGYRDDSINITVSMMRRYNTDIMVAYVQIADASQIRTELCGTYPSTATAPVANLAKRVNAVCAINGDYFSYVKTGYIVRNGDLLRHRYDSKYDLLIIDDAGDFHIIKSMTEENVAAYEGTIAQSFAFGPGLVIDGVVNHDFPLMNNGPTRRTQRMVLGQIDHLTYIIVATEGPENKGSTGLTMVEIADLMGELGAVNAYNLDGGSSSTLVMNNKKINSLSSGKVRPIGDIIYFVTAIPEEE